MIRIIRIMCLACLLVSCSASQEEIAQIKSPDGRGVAIIVRKANKGLPSPPPEPTRTTDSWSQLIVSRDGKVVYNSGFERLGGDQGRPPYTWVFDLLWSTDSERLVYRKVNTVRVVSMDRRVLSFDIVTDNALVSSFKWISSNELLVVSKGVSDQLDLFGEYIQYYGMATNSTYVKVSRVNIDTRKVEQRFKQEVKRPPFVFNSIGFENDEISPYSGRVVFSDGENINVFDDASGKVIAKAPIDGSIKEIRWADNNRVVVGLGVPGARPSQRNFVVFDIKTGKIHKKNP